MQRSKRRRGAWPNASSSSRCRNRRTPTPHPCQARNVISWHPRPHRPQSPNACLASSCTSTSCRCPSPPPTSPTNSRSTARKPSSMAPKARHPEKPAATATASSPAKSASKPSGHLDAHEIVQSVWSKYVEKTPQRVKLLDCFMAFLAVVGALQFLYCLLVGNFVRSSMRPQPLALGPVSPSPRLGFWLSLTCTALYSPSMPFWLASVPPSANSSSQPRSASRPILKTRPISRASRMNAPSLTMSLAR